MRSLPFLIHEALLNLRRHRLATVAAISAIAISLSLLGAFALAFYEVDGVTRHAQTEFEMRVFLKPGVSEEEARRMQRRVMALPGVDSATFLPKEEVFASQAKDSGLDLSGIPNLMPDTFAVRLADAREAENVARTLRGWQTVDEVSVMDQELRTVLRLTTVVRAIGTMAGVILLLAALAVVANTIRLSVFARRREIKIMQIVGASAMFIRLPLVLEGLIHGLVGGAVAAGGTLLLGSYIAGLFSENLPQFLPYTAPVDFLMVGLMLLATGALLGTCGSLMAIRRYLRAL